MQRVAGTVEEQLILKAIKEQCPWDKLPKRLQVTLGSKEEWHIRIVEYCIKKRLPWADSFARKVIKQNEYYEDMMRYLRNNLALFPYHLADYFCRIMRISSFKYYCDIIFEVMKSEQPYDSIPNFSAADALLLTGIGRNEFIDIMNKCKSKKIMWKLNKSIAKEFLPTQPVDFAIEPWWGVCLVNFTLEEFKKLSEEEMATIDKISKEEANAYILFDPEIIKGLYRRGLVYFDVPVYPDDRFKVSRLEGFVSNREQLYEDPTEELLYAVFVVSNQNSTVAELAATLQADLSQLQFAASFACRLGWAVKVIDPASVLQDTSASGSYINLSDDEDGSRASVSSAYMSTNGNTVQRDVTLMENRGASLGYARVAFVVDANITSYLMMGSVSPGLKSHAVTLYEAGKLGHASIVDLCKDLSTLESTKFEGELREFANHAFSLRCVLECLLLGGVATGEYVSDQIIAVSSRNSGNDEYLLDADHSKHSSGYLREPTFVAHITGGTNKEISSSLSSDIDKDLISSVGKKKYHVDILRCESLASLAPATLDRLFLRDYDIVVSMVPLPPSSVLPGPKGPIHFGPPCYSSMTPWMKLVLYSAVGNGPISVVLMKGQHFRMLPAPLSGCEKALIWSWDGSTIGGLGGKFEGNLVKGSVLLHCLNSLLKYSAVLVQPLSKSDLDKSGQIVTIDVPFPLINSDGSIADIGEELGLPANESLKLNSMLCDLANKIELWTIGHIRLLKLFKENESGDDKYEWVPLSIEFGIPLFSPKLCKSICKRVVGSQLLQMDLLSKHQNAMQDLRKKLQDICAAYESTGLSARLLYQKEQPITPSKQLMNYASGRWNPLIDPSSPISGASSEHQRLKFANRHRHHSEVLSFDGNIVRSYALSSVYEAALRSIEEEEEEEWAMSTSVKDGNGDVEKDEDERESKEVILPGIDLIFDGCEVYPFDISACLQARQPITLIAEASVAFANIANRNKL